MTFINADAVLELLDKRTEEMTAEATTESRKATANSFTIHSLKFAVEVVTGIRNEIGLMLALPGYPDPEPPASESADGPMGEEGDPIKGGACGFFGPDYTPPTTEGD